ncbi:MAG: hypothetical protein Q7U02_07565 [Desulfosalsimonadaceae bacterium]|nr:hypothetical protein [Desulfosalsimonadaceae bacterium]
MTHVIIDKLDFLVAICRCGRLHCDKPVFRISNIVGFRTVFNKGYQVAVCIIIKRPGAVTGHGLPGILVQIVGGVAAGISRLGDLRPVADGVIPMSPVFGRNRLA